VITRLAVYHVREQWAAPQERFILKLPGRWVMWRASVTAALAMSAAAAAAFSAEPAGPRVLQADGIEIRVDLPDSEFSAGAQPVLAWIKRSADIVAHYYGRFPTRELRITVIPTGGGGVHGGTTFGRFGGYIRVRVGRDTVDAQLVDDWVLVHEMIHLALPDVGENHSWLSEGISTYVEGIARAQMGNRTIEDVWSEQMRSMPKGLPQPGDRGLDNTHTWGRTYWGGALFCLQADVEIRRRTHNRYGLQDALRAVNRESGGIVADWPIERVFKTGDAAVGVAVLEELYAKAKDAPMSPDREALWRELGIEPHADGIIFHDDAPLAGERKAILPSAGR
jgi:hypothetical protein